MRGCLDMWRVLRRDSRCWAGLWSASGGGRDADSTAVSAPKWGWAAQKWRWPSVDERQIGWARTGMEEKTAGSELKRRKKLPKDVTHVRDF